MNTVNALNKPGFKKFIPGICWFIFVMFLLFLPGSNLPSVGGWFNTVYFDKWVHAGLFAILAFLFMYPYIRSALPAKERWFYVIRIALATSVWGITSELIQKYFVPGRYFDLLDWAADSFGGLVALIFSKIRFFSSK